MSILLALPVLAQDLPPLKTLKRRYPEFGKGIKPWIVHGPNKAGYVSRHQAACGLWPADPVCGECEGSKETLPLKEIERVRVDRLIERLGSPIFREREESTRELERGDLRVANYLRSRVSSDPEIRWRLDHVLRQEPSIPIDARTLACTGAALLRLVGCGYTQQSREPLGDHIRRAVKKLLRLQQEDGSFADVTNREGVLAHLVITLSFCELYGFTQSNDLRGPLRQAIAKAVSLQQDDGAWPTPHATFFSVGILWSARLHDVGEFEEAREKLTRWMKARENSLNALDPVSLAAMVVHDYSLQKRGPARRRACDLLFERFGRDDEWGAVEYHAAAVAACVCHRLKEALNLLIDRRAARQCKDPSKCFFGGFPPVTELDKRMGPVWVASFSGLSMGYCFKIQLMSPVHGTWVDAP